MAAKSNQQPLSFALGSVEPRSIVSEIQESYLDYAMSVIIARALPDVRDGLKPVHRRILYAMWQLGLKSDAKFRKSAAIVGEVLGKYHPHGDVAVYDSLVRMAQEFSMRELLVRGQGNFGSVDGDSAAAMRYTEAKLAPIAHELLGDIEKETVPFTANYDGTQQEPTVLPSAVPNLLLNGTVGIAVGMATNIPPHNLGELCDAVQILLDNPEVTVKELMSAVKGPDFPTAGICYHAQAIEQAYATGRGALVMRSKAEIVESGSGYAIIVTEIPFQVNKANLLEHIAELVATKKIEGIRDLRDESNREGIRIVIELKRDAVAQKVLNQLYHHSQLQETFHVNMLSLIDGIQPKLLNLKMMLEEFVKHRKVVIRARTQYELNRIKERLHILDGLVIALEHIDQIIAIIKKSKDRADAKENLIKKFRFTDRQAIAILEMKLQQLANLERLAVEEERKTKQALAKELQNILDQPKKVTAIIHKELSAIKEKYATVRKTQIMKSAPGEFSAEDLIADEPTMVMISRDGYLKRLPIDTFRVQGRGGKGVVGMTTKEEDSVENFFVTNTHADLLFFTSRGRVFQLKAYDVPMASRTARGQAVVNFLELDANEKVTAVLTNLTPEQKYFVMVTRQGTIKKVDRSEMSNVRRSGLIAIKLAPNDVLEWVVPTRGSDEIFLVSSKGQAIRYPEKFVRAMGRTAAGVRGMKLKGGDAIVGAFIIQPDVHKSETQVVVVTNLGFGKRTALKQFKRQGRGGVGIKIAKVTPKTGGIAGAFLLPAGSETREGDIIIISMKGQVIRLSSKMVSVLGRATQGVRVMRFKEEKDEVASVTVLPS
ncbi:DNA gyrase subunit A [Candidatus Uhrbacteria bacterium]|nr:DNA gyrase subunit A [Candidatus Uhrbacteria bacterium]